MKRYRFTTSRYGLDPEKVGRAYDALRAKLGVDVLTTSQIVEDYENGGPFADALPDGADLRNIGLRTVASFVVTNLESATVTVRSAEVSETDAAQFDRVQRRILEHGKRTVPLPRSSFEFAENRRKHMLKLLHQMRGIANSLDGSQYADFREFAQEWTEAIDKGTERINSMKIRQVG